LSNPLGRTLPTV